jgi:hypothetical protein
MNTEQLLLTKWHRLNPKKQREVLNFMDFLVEVETPETSTQDDQPQTELGKKLWEIRQKIVKNPQIKLLDWDEIEAELDEIRGKN